MPFKSKFSDAPLDYIHSVPQFITLDTEKFSNKNAFVDGITGRAITYGQFGLYIKKIGASLHKKGITKGNVIAILSPNSPDYPVIFHGIISIGAIVTTLNPISTVEEMSTQLKDCKALMIYTVPLLLDKVLAIKQNVPSITELF